MSRPGAGSAGGGGASLLLCLAAAAAWAAVPAPGAAGGLLDRVKARGSVVCGLHADLPALARRDAEGAWSGLESDICRLVAAAVLGEGGAVDFIPLPAEERLSALAGGRVDLLGLEAAAGLPVGGGHRFAALAFVDGQGLMTRRDGGAGNALALDGAAVCLLDDAQTEANLARFAAGNGITLVPIAFADVDAMAAAFAEGGCAALSASRLTMAALRGRLPGESEILPELLSREQWGPVVADGDRTWLEVVRWSLFATLEAEERGITSETAEGQRAASKDPRVLRLLGAEGDLGTQLGLARSWAFEILRQVGNYAEIYDRHFGPRSPSPLPRGPNALWLDGGVLQAPAFQ